MDCMGTGSPKCGHGSCEVGETAGEGTPQYACQCEPGWAKSVLQWEEGEDLCVIPQTPALIIYVILCALSAAAMLSVCASSWYSLRKLVRQNVDRVKVRGAFIRRLCLVCATLGAFGASLSGLIPSAYSESHFEMGETACRWLVIATVFYGYFIFVLMTFQLEKYYRLTFKDKVPRALFPCLHCIQTICFCVSVVLSVFSPLKTCAQFGLISFGLFSTSMIVLYHYGFSRLRFQLKTALKDKNTGKVARKKLQASIKRNKMLQFVVSSAFLSGAAIPLVMTLVPDVFRSGQLLTPLIGIFSMIGVLVLQLDFIHKLYFEHMERLARQLKALERQGVVLKTKWAEIKAYAMPSSVYTASVAPTEDANGEQSLSSSKPALQRDKALDESIATNGAPPTQPHSTNQANGGWGTAYSDDGWFD